MRQMPSKIMTLNARSTTLPISRRVIGVVRKSVPPKKIISICMTEIKSIIMTNGRFFPIFESIHIRSHRAEKQLKMPRKIKRA